MPSRTMRMIGCLLPLLLAWLPASAESLRVDPAWLHENLAREDLVILDVRDSQEYEIEHIPGAISLPDSLSYRQKASSGRIVEPGVMQQLMRERGIRLEDLVVVYDDGGMLDASRVFWALEVYGLKRVRVLQQGYPGWRQQGYPATDAVPAVAPSAFVPRVDHRRIASKFSTRLASINPQQVVLDARPENAYRGETSTAKRFGHIPSAINIPVHANIERAEGGMSLRGAATLKDLYAGVPRTGKVVLYCEIGRVSATSYLVLRELGYDVANYDASWKEWGNDLALPIEK